MDNYADFVQKCGSDAIFAGRSVTDSIRTLTKYQDVSDAEISNILAEYEGPIEGLELLLSQTLLPLGISEHIDDSNSYPLLATALRNGANSRQLHDFRYWGPFIRRLVCRGADIHAHVPQDCGYSGTLLDELFNLTSTPADAKAAADEWLQMLAGEGHDVVAYLEREKSTHSTHRQMTYPSYDVYNLPRELIFELDGLESHVYWDWWIDPESTTRLLRSEFRQMIMFTTSLPLEETWKALWPFRYPAWHDDCSPFYHDTKAVSERERLNAVAQRRANRRLQKRYENSTRSRGLRYPNMPGAWCT